MRRLCSFSPREQPTRGLQVQIIDFFPPWILFTMSVARRYDSIDWMFEAMAGTLISVGSRWAGLSSFTVFAGLASMSAMNGPG